MDSFGRSKSDSGIFHPSCDELVEPVGFIGVPFLEGFRVLGFRF